MSKPSRRRPRTILAEIPQTGPYEHRQAGKTILALLGIPTMLCLASMLSHPQYAISLLTISIVLTIAAILFSSLRTEVNNETLSWRFGPGLIRKQVAIADIAEASVTRSTRLEGWGIHYTRRGWLYNVSGTDCVYIKLKSGKSFLIGSNDAIGLWEAIMQRVDQRA